MDITILCSSGDHPISPWLLDWKNRNNKKHNIVIIRSRNDAPGGDILFLISCSELIKLEDRKKYKASLVVHASDLPLGRGWSPHVWQIIEGQTSICVSLLEAECKVDSGKIWHQVLIDIPKHYLFDEINRVLFEAEILLMDYAIDNFETITPYEQKSNIEPSYYPRRSVEDSRLDTELSIRSQFDLLRICDPERYPAFFELHGKKYVIKLEKFSE